MQDLKGSRDMNVAWIGGFCTRLGDCSHSIVGFAYRIISIPHQSFSRGNRSSQVNSSSLQIAWTSCVPRSKVWFLRFLGRSFDGPWHLPINTCTEIRLGWDVLLGAHTPCHCWEVLQHKSWILDAGYLGHLYLELMKLGEHDATYSWFLPHAQRSSCCCQEVRRTLDLS